MACLQSKSKREREKKMVALIINDGQGRLTMLCMYALLTAAVGCLALIEILCSCDRYDEHQHYTKVLHFKRMRIN